MHKRYFYCVCLGTDGSQMSTTIYIYSNREPFTPMHIEIIKKLREHCADVFHSDFVLLPPMEVEVND